ncbi:hypothetical protein [Xanthocytophaga agilis]|uniref:Uncharacterized protein n=1 Tax=Xanthocytophaga agilis TaxID=3048010 RepID=A0AAE3RD13_9BACT|nr:hypothetical protein [Xanthocytophaga agilis]MDJ1506259.1 hypothetical protein [Xanthocytophaga agilis]
MSIEQPCYFILLPLVCALLVNEHIVDAGQIFCQVVKSGEQLNITTPFDDEYINFIEVSVRADKNNSAQGYEPPLCVCDFSLTQNSLTLLSLDFLLECFYIGKFDRRAEYILDLKHTSPKVLAFNLNEPFEIEGRLLYERDMVLLWDCEAMESLTSESLLLAITP